MWTPVSENHPIPDLEGPLGVELGYFLTLLVRKLRPRVAKRAAPGHTVA